MPQARRESDSLQQALVSPCARFYLVALKEDNLPKIQQRMLKWHGLHSEVCLWFQVSAVSADRSHQLRFSSNTVQDASIRLCHIFSECPLVERVR